MWWPSPDSVYLGELLDAGYVSTVTGDEQAQKVYVAQVCVAQLQAGAVSWPHKLQLAVH